MVKIANSVRRQTEVSYLDGARLKRAVMAAARRVVRTEERLNRMNVFPVADWDTGTNMALTLRGAAEALRNAGNIDLGQMSALLADSALLSARGNSGVILAQFFQGIASGFAGQKRIGLEEFSLTMRQAAHFAEKGVASPCEGTILTVMRDWASSVERNWLAAPGFVELLQSSLNDAQASLQKTPSQLKVLAKAKVLDAGAQGFVNMLEGIVHLLKEGETHWTDAAPLLEVVQVVPNDDIAFRYCTECVVHGTDLDLASIRVMAQSLGNSLVVAGNRSTARIHVHTNDPALLFARAATLGVVSNPKQEDIWAQRNQAQHHRGLAPIAVITDSSCDLPPDYVLRHDIYMVPVRITFGKTEYLDRVTITSDEVYEMLERSPEPPKTSQATPESFLLAYERAAENHRDAIAVLVSAATSGTFQSGVLAAQKQKAMKIEVVDSKTTSAALGFLVQTAVEAIEEGCSLPEVRRRVEEARNRIKVFFSVGSLQHLIRTGRVGSAYNLIAKLLNLVPVLSFSPQGSIMSTSRSRPGKPSWVNLLEIVIKESAKLSEPRFRVCHSAEEEGAAYLAEELVRRLQIEPPEILKISPTMGAMVGPGACVLAIMGAPENRRHAH